MMNESRIYKGYWWLPPTPEERIAGTLTIEPNGTVKLELYGCFGPEDDYVIFERKDDPVIYGRCYTPNSKIADVSLMECHSAMTLNFSINTFPVTRYTCRFALIGIHINSIGNCSFFKAYVDFKELTHWCPPQNITTTLKKGSISVCINTEVEDAVPLATISLDDGYKLKLRESATYKPDYPSVYIDQSTFLEILKDDMSGYDVLSMSRMFERFLSIATLSPVEHGKITLYSYQKYLKEGDKLFHCPIELVTYLYKSDTSEPFKPYDYLFKYDDIVDYFDNMFKKVYSDKSIAQILSNLIDSLENKRVFTSNDFLVVIQALDGFSIRFRKEQDLLLQLTALRDEFKNIKKLSLTDDDLRAAKGSRDYYSHILKLEKKEKRNALEGWKLFDLTKKLRILLLCCILNFMGVDNDKINLLLNQCNNSILR